MNTYTYTAVYVTSPFTVPAMAVSTRALDSGTVVILPEYYDVPILTGLPDDTIVLATHLEKAYLIPIMAHFSNAQMSAWVDFWLRLRNPITEEEYNA